jgi:hypothetical protein
MLQVGATRINEPRNIIKKKLENIGILIWNISLENVFDLLNRGQGFNLPPSKMILVERVRTFCAGARNTYTVTATILPTAAARVQTWVWSCGIL